MARPCRDVACNVSTTPTIAIAPRTDAINRVSTFAIALFFALMTATPAFAANGEITYLDVGTTQTDLDATQDQNGTGWSWVAATNTFTLSGDITGSIRFYGSGIGDVNFVVNGMPTVTAGIYQNVGKLTISGSNTLTLTNTLQTGGDLEISAATVNVNSVNNDGVFTNGGNIIMSSGTLNATATGNLAAGISTNGSGNLYISGSASVSATSTESDGIYCNDITVSGGTLSGTSTNQNGIRVVGDITISDGAVTANSSNTTWLALYAVGDVDVTGGTLTTVGGSNGNLATGGSLKVSGTTTNVTVNGKITKVSDSGGNLEVSNGTVTVGGTVAGSTIVLGGTVSVDGSTVPPLDTAVADLITKLKSSSTQNISVATDVALPVWVDMGASHTLSIATGKTLTLSGDGGIGIGANTLTVNGGGALTVAKANSHGLYSIEAGGTLELASITVNLQNTTNFGLRVRNINVGNGAAINLNSATGNDLIYLIDASLNVGSGGSIHIQDFNYIGITLSYSTLHINGGTVTVGAGSSWNRGINVSASGMLKLSNGGTLTGSNGGGILLNQAAKVEGLNGLFNDRGTAFTANGQVTVDVSAAAASADGLTHGMYMWNGSVFAKTAPAFVSAATSADGAKVLVTFSEAMSSAINAAGDFTVASGGSANTVTAIALNGTDNKIVELTLTTPVTAGQTVTVAYTKGTATSASGVPLESFAAQSVTNTLGGGNPGTFGVSIGALSNGDVSASPNANITAGTIVTLTVTPAAGYELDDVTVTGSDGNVATVETDNYPSLPTPSLQTYTFTMPACDVTVTATFRKTAVTGIESLESTALKAYMKDGLLHVSGLIAGKLWAVYNISGALIYQSIASSDEADVSLPVQGVYIVKSDSKTIKVVYLQ